MSGSDAIPFHFVVNKCIGSETDIPDIHSPCNKIHPHIVEINTIQTIRRFMNGFFNPFSNNRFPVIVKIDGQTGNQSEQAQESDQDPFPDEGITILFSHISV